MLTGLAPVLLAPNIQEALDRYCDVLGLEVKSLLGEAAVT